MADLSAYTKTEIASLVTYFNVTREELGYQGGILGGTWLGAAIGKPAAGEFYTQALLDRALQEIEGQREEGITTPRGELQAADTEWSPEWSAGEYWERAGEGMRRDIIPYRNWGIVIIGILGGIILWRHL